MTAEVPQKRGRGRPRRSPMDLAAIQERRARAGLPPGTSWPAKTINPVDAHVGARLKLRRTLIGMSQTELGAILGLTFQQIQKYEKGHNRLTAGRLMEVADLMGVAVQYFFEDLPIGAARASTRDAGNPGPGVEGDTFAQNLLTPDGALMLHGFNRISSPMVRRRLINLINHIANESEGEKS